jgi:formate dehydrogenase beta subunit
MADVIFSSWQGTIIDNRGKTKEAYTPLSVKLPEEFDKGASVRAFIGWDGIILRDEGIDIIDMCLTYVGAVKKESCGRCLPCRIGSKVIWGILKDIAEGRGKPGDIAKINEIAATIRDGSNVRSDRPVLCPFCMPYSFLPHNLSEPLRWKKGGQRQLSCKCNGPCMSVCPSPT